MIEVKHYAYSQSAAPDMALVSYVEAVGGEMSPSELRQVIEKLVQKAAA